MNYDYRIGGLWVRFEIPWSLGITTESEPFLFVPETGDIPDLTFSFSNVDSLPQPEQGGTWNIDAYYCTDDQGVKIWHTPVRSRPPYCCVVWSKDSADRVECLCVQGQEHQIAYTKNLIDLLSLESFLLHFDGLILHSSLVNWDGKGILFSAPCGTGKSTQARLWEQYMNSSTLNGDRAGIRRDDGVWTAWGLPFAGSSGIYRNESVPIRAIVLLGQSKENTLSKVRPMDAFKRLLPECSARRWDAGFMDQLIHILFAMISDVPVYQLDCRPDREAVELLRDTLLEDV